MCWCSLRPPIPSSSSPVSRPVAEQEPSSHHPPRKWHPFLSQHHTSLSQASRNPTPTWLLMCPAHRHRTRWSSHPYPPSDSSTCQPSLRTPHTQLLQVVVLPLPFLPLPTITFSSHFSIRRPHHLVQEQPQLHGNRFMLERLHPFHLRQRPTSLQACLSRDPGWISLGFSNL